MLQAKAAPLDTYYSWYAENERRIIADLSSYIGLDTTSPTETSALPFLKTYLEPLGFTLQQSLIPDAFWEHSERAPAPVSKLNTESTCLRAFRPGGNGRKLIVNAHVDVVPLQQTFSDGFRARCTADRIIGRGSVDTKGNLVIFSEALRYLIQTGRQPAHAITLDLVAEEERGGNGALASCLSGADADCALVLEPTNGEVFIGHRGCLSFAADFIGQSGHMGAKPASGASAIEAAAYAVLALRKLESAMDSEKHRYPAFASWDKSVQINVGAIDGGDWYGSVASQCRISGNCGFLPELGLAGTQALLEATMRDVIAEIDNMRVEWNWPALHNEAYLCDPADPFLTCLSELRNQPHMRAWNVSCDGRHYARILGIPTAIFGFGTLAAAHAADEALSRDDLKIGILAMAELLQSPLGGRHGTA